MKVCFITLGSRGDVQPVIALGAALRERGHDVVIACMGAGLVALVQSAGLRAHELIHTLPDHDEGYQKSLHNPISRVRAWRDYMKATFPKVSRELNVVCEGADIVLAHSDALNLVVATTSKTGGKVMGYRFFPGTMNSAYPVTQYTPAGWAQQILESAPGFVKRATWRVGEYITWQHIRWVLNYHRNALGLPPHRSFRDMSRETANIPDIQFYDQALVPELSSEFGADKPMLGFLQVAPKSWQRNEEQERAAEDVRTWMRAGEPPIYWGFGSIRVSDPDGLARMFADVCRRNGQRGLIVAGWSDLADRDLGDHVKVVESVEHATVLPLCKAAVHHGGAGTTAACLRAGLPSLICSVLADQPFWGRRIQALGVGAHVPVQQLTEKKLEDALRVLLSAKTVERAQTIAQALIPGAQVAQRAAQAIESAVPAQPAAPVESAEPAQPAVP
ncbi:Sterol 3-beta-glucosyltransferase [Segniliparus rotundus DSM 44985]|uniref:Sterol 3-beta-glucosyltransferase n=2 Tax=Segniliparus rotundus TaxID=286802 RepID=D6ZBK9_SEGRD|nr:Sterol 3-beta-glucosyltransferase [Segniliparus rotundus DSM 44985]